MRHGEIHRAKASHLDPAAGTYTVLKPSKNGDVRTIPIEPEFFSSGRPLMPWVQARPIDAADPDALWTSRLRWTKKPNTPKRLTYAQVGKDLKEIGRAVGVDVNFYRTRATRATALKRADVSDRTIQRILGHAKLETTTRYVQHLMVDVADDLRRHKPASPIKRPPRESES
jgi:integrase